MTMNSTSTAPCAILNGRLRVRRRTRRERVQRRYFQEKLHDQHEHVEVERDDGADHVDAPPRTGELFQIERNTRRHEHDERDDPGDMRSQQRIAAEKDEAGEARQERRENEEMRRAVACGSR